MRFWVTLNLVITCISTTFTGCKSPGRGGDWATTPLPTAQHLLLEPSDRVQSNRAKSNAADVDIVHKEDRQENINWETIFRAHAKPASEQAKTVKQGVAGKSDGRTELDGEAGKFEEGKKIADEPADEFVISSETVKPQDPDQSQAISLEQLESIAIAQHPSLSKYRSRIDVAKGKRLQAGLPYNPTLQYQSQEIGNDGSSGIHSVSVSQRFVTGDKLAIGQQVQTHVVNQQQSELARRTLQVRTEVQVKFAQALLEQQRVDLSLQIQSLADQSVQTVSELVEAGEVSRVALLQAKVEAQRAKLTSDNAHLELTGARRELAASVSIAVLPDQRLSGAVSDDLSDAPWESLLSELLATSPELAAAGSQLQQAQQTLHLTCAQNIPDVTAQFGLGVDTATDDTFASLGVSVPLPIRNRNQGNIHSARANIAVADASLSQIELDLSRRLADAVARYQVAKQRYQRLRQTVLPLANESFQLSMDAFRAGETNYLELLTAQRSLFKTRLSAIEALAQAQQAIAEINGQLVTVQ